MKNLDDMIKDGYIKKSKHPSEDIYILNYTPKTQYESFWNETTMACRGLIVDQNNNPISRCFKKFFNYNEVKDKADVLLSTLDYSIYEKIDGSLGISYFIGDKPQIATRGSFTSDQAVKANEILNSKKIKLDKNLTYLFEIVYPENKIVVNYGQKEDLILLGIIDNTTEEEIDIHQNKFGFDVCEKIHCSSIHELDKSKSNFEGYVVKFENGFRFKIKLEEYVKLHKLLFGLSSREIWSCLRSGTDVELSGVPDEIFSWIKNTKNSIISDYNNIKEEYKNYFEKIYCHNRKEFAEKALKYRHSGILFKMFDKKSFEKMLWDIVEPAYFTYKGTLNE